MSVQNSLTKSKSNQRFGITAYLTQDAVKQQINNVIGGKDGQRFISAIVSAVNTNPALQECTNQSTGLKDKNGKLIFEGDIMEGHIDEEFPEDVSQFEVEWSGNGWVMAQRGCIDKEYISEFETENYEVVGNIFDNSPDRSTNTPTDTPTKQLHNFKRALFTP